MTREWFTKKLKELYIRFNTSPKVYQKSDFYLLLLLLGGLIEKESESGNINNVDISGEGGVVTNITKEENTLVVTKGLVRYPKARWARRGFIDLTNCKDIDYIIVPCTTKQQCLYVTNDYLKSLRHVETYQSIYGLELLYDEYGNPIIPEDFFKLISKYFDNIITTIPIIYNLPRILTIDNLSSENLPCTTSIDKFINIKEFAVTKNPKNLYRNPLRILFNRKDIHNGFIQFPYFINNSSEDFSYLNTKFIFTPYQVFANPFNSTLGGVIPVKDGKLLIEKATRLKNKTLELVSTGQLIRFDEYGICDTLFNPETYVYTTLKSGRKGKSGDKCLRKVIISNPVKSPRRSCTNARRRVRMAHGMEWHKGYHYRESSSDWSTIKWSDQIPYVINKRNYNFKDDGSYSENINCLILKLTYSGIDRYMTLFNPLSRIDKKYYQAGYLVFNTKNPRKGTIVKYYKAPYDRMNTYTINKYSKLIRIFRPFSIEK